MTTNNDLRVQIGQQLITIGQIEGTYNDTDNTPSNLATLSQAEKARTLLEGVFNSLPSDENSIDASVAKNYNVANANYKSLVSVAAEFAATSWPSFTDAVAESAGNLPNTLEAWGENVGSAIGKTAAGVGNFVGGTVKDTIFKLFGNLGWFSYVLLFAIAIGALSYFVPGWWKVLKK